MNNSITRRSFLKQSSILSAGLTSLAVTASLRAATGANEKIRLGIIGCNGRGMAHIAGYLSVPYTEIAYICDVDSRAVAKGIAAVAKKQDRKPEGVKDLRRILDDSRVDAVSIPRPITGTPPPRFWPAPPANTFMWKNRAATTRMRAS